jgi:hypothetical protein
MNMYGLVPLQFGKPFILHIFISMFSGMRVVSFCSVENDAFPSLNAPSSIQSQVQYQNNEEEHGAKTIPYEYTFQIRRYVTFFLYSPRVYLSNTTVPDLFSLFATDFVIPHLSIVISSYSSLLLNFYLFICRILLFLFLFLFLFSGMRIAIYETPRQKVLDEEHGTQRKRYGTAHFGMVLGAVLRIRDQVPF